MLLERTRIKRLSSDVVNQIAAGEVVERPAQLIKELVENSIDAGATQIDIDIQDGGRFVQVSDNGRGIHPDDLGLALDRHATSKIEMGSDLWQLASYGFRGEALSSIASISRMTLTSRSAGFEQAAQITSTFGSLSEVTTVGHTVGTTLRIEELFANVPARLKFMKSVAAETSSIKTTLKALSLSQPTVQFRLRQEGRLLFFSAANSNPLEKVKQVLEETSLFFLEAQEGNYHLQLVFGSPEVNFGTTKNLYFFVQNRWVQDRSLQAAILQAYRGLLMQQSFPLAVAWITLPPNQVDVNIHPNKSQVKFQDPTKIFQLLYHNLRRKLEQAPWRSQSRELPEIPFQEAREKANENLQSDNWVLGEPKRSYSSEVKPIQREVQPKPEPPPQSMKLPETPRLEDPKQSSYWANLQIVGQVHLTYIVAQSEKSLVLIDQHAAHERIVYERFMQNWRNNEQRRLSQLLLIPLELVFENDLVEALISQKDHLYAMGIEIDQRGQDSLVVRSIPPEIKENAIAKSLELFGQQINKMGKSFSIEIQIENFAASLACHSVVRAGQLLQRAEMASLLQQMDSYPLSSYCPHGRPVSIELSWPQLERDFGRKI